MENLGEFIVNHWILVSLFVVLSWLVFSDTLTRRIAGVKPVSANQAVQIINQQKGVFVDIREKAEFEQEHIAESVSIPLSTLPEGLSALGNKQKPVVIVCASGQRARNAVKHFRSNAFDDVYTLTGGLHAWKEAKLPLFS